MRGHGDFGEQKSQRKKPGHLDGVVVDALIRGGGRVGDPGRPPARRPRRRDGGPSPARRVPREPHEGGRRSGGGGDRGEPRGAGGEEASERGGCRGGSHGVASAESERERWGSGSAGAERVVCWRIKAAACGGGGEGVGGGAGGGGLACGDSG